MKRAYLIENIPNAGKNIKDAMKGICELKVCKDINLALQEMLAYKPDLLIINLAFPGVRELNLLTHICALGLRPAILASDNIHMDPALFQILFEASNQRLEVLMRPFHIDYLVDRVLSMLYMLDEENGCPRQTISMRDTTKQFLLSLGVRPNLQSFHYAVDALVYMAKTGSTSLQCDVYVVVANKYSVTNLAVERGIRQLLSQTCQRGLNPYWELYFPFLSQRKKNNITNSEFLIRVSMMLSEKLKIGESVK